MLLLFPTSPFSPPFLKSVMMLVYVLVLPFELECLIKNALPPIKKANICLACEINLSTG